MARTIGVYLYPETSDGINKRGDNRSQTINRDLERLYYMYDRSIRETPLEVGEACLLVDCLNGSPTDPRSAGLLWASVEDSIALEGLDKKWGVDGQKLVGKIKNMNILQQMALVDAAERFWAKSEAWESTEAGARECFNV